MRRRIFISGFFLFLLFSLPLRSANEPAVMPNGVSVPGDFPYLNISVHDNPHPDRFFLNNRDDAAPYILIFNNDGSPYWYRKLPHRMRDFNLQPNGLLTGQWLEMINGSLGLAFYVGLDSSYAVVDTFYAGPGAYMDEHDLIVRPDGHYFAIVYDYQTMDMSQIVPGGNPNALIDATHIRELDENDQVVWEWRSLDHLSLADLEPALQDPRANTIDFPHINSMDFDDDGQLVISSRHISEVTKINLQTGDVLWRLGGKSGQFTFVNDPLNGFSGQHDCRCLGNGHYTVFDNGNGHQPPVSRAVEYALDTEAMTATLVWEYRDDTPKFSWRFGNVQVLDNGNRLINWGANNYSKLTEVRPDGSKAYEMNFAQRFECYRVHRYPWDVPAKTPYLILEPSGTGAALIFNQFGDDHVDYYKIYHGTAPNPETLLDTSRSTLKIMEVLENKAMHYFRVTSVSKNGAESSFSNQDSLFVKSIQAGENHIINQDFSDGDRFWDLIVNGNVSASGAVEDGVYHIAIQEGSGGWNVYLAQSPVHIIRREPYVLEFEAWADPSMRIKPAVIDTRNGTDYARIGDIQIDAVPVKYTYSFTSASDQPEAALVFEMEDKAGHIYFDNISLRHGESAHAAQTASVHPELYRLFGNYPNPFNGTTTLRFSIPQPCRVTLSLLDVLGKNVKDFMSGDYTAGAHEVRFQSESMGSGVYFFRMTADPGQGSGTIVKVNKMLYMK